MWLFGDSVGRYATADLPTKYQIVGASGNGVRVTPGAGRDGSPAIEFTNGNGKLGRAVVSSRPTCFCGFAFKSASLDGIVVHSLYDGVNGRGQVVYVTNSDGSISAWQITSNTAFMTNALATLIGVTPPGLLFTGVQHHLQFGTTIDAIAGFVKIRIDGVSRLSLTGQNTRNSGASGNSFTMIGIGGGSAFGSAFVGDIWACDDDTGPADGRTDFLGDMVSDACFTNGPGTSTGMTPSAGANYAQVADATPDGDATFVSSGTVGAKDTYAHSPLVRVATDIKCVQLLTTARKTTGGSRSICHVMRSGGTDYDSADLALPDTYGMQITALPLDPNTGADWASPAAVNATEIGQKVTA